MSIRKWLREFDSNPVMNQRNIMRYSNAALNQPESVLVHSGEMQEMVLLLYNEIFKPSGIEFDFKDAIYRAFIHDMDETVLCDIPRNIKYFDNDIHEKINKIAEEELRNSNFCKEIIDDIFNAKDENVFEGVLIKVLDVVQALHKLSKELKLQSTYNIYAKFNESTEYLGNYISHLREKSSDPKYKLLIDFMEQLRDEAIELRGKYSSNVF